MAPLVVLLIRGPGLAESRKTHGRWFQPETKKARESLAGLRENIELRTVYAAFFIRRRMITKASAPKPKIAA